MKKFLIIFVCYYFTISNSLAAPVTIHLSDMEKFSGLSKEVILQKRQEAVRTSPLFDLLGNEYTPNLEVFQIEDEAPWISAHELSCYGMDDSKDISKGVSRESLAILNPELLIHLEILSYRFNKIRNGCSPVDYLIPYKVTYDAEKKLITAHINYSAFLKKNKIFYNVSLMDSNAHDLGYNYVVGKVIDKNSNGKHNRNSSKRKVIWKSSKNVTNSIVETKGYYHLGGNVCQNLGGCNNYSPAQPEYDFDFNKLPTELHFKLWKNMPNQDNYEADISYIIIFE